MTDQDPGAFASVVIVAAGRGERFGDTAKVLALAGGRPLIAWSVIAASQAACVRDILIVTSHRTDEAIRLVVGGMALDKPVAFVAGGVRRQDSVAAGVAAVPRTSDVVLVHDGARPLVTASVFEACAYEARRTGAAIVAIPVSDTLKRVRESRILETVAREGLWSAQTPQGFGRQIIQQAFEQARVLDVEFTDEASLLEYRGHVVRIVPGDRSNIKVTHPEDLELVDALLWRRFRQVEE